MTNHSPCDDEREDRNYDSDYDYVEYIDPNELTRHQIHNPKEYANVIAKQYDSISLKEFYDELTILMKFK